MIVVNPFRGENLKQQELLKRNIFSICAKNAQLHDGSLRPYPCPEVVCEHDFEPCTIYSSKECECIALPQEALFDENHDFTFWAQEGHCVKKSACFCDGETCDVGIPCPDHPLTASGNSPEGCDFDPRVYYYTWVAKFCNGCESEGPMSPPSNQVCGGPAVVGGGSMPPVGSCVTHMRIYRAQSGWKSGEENGVTNNSGITLVGEVAVGTGFTDNLSVGSSTMIGPITERMGGIPSDVKGVGVSAFSTFYWKGRDLYFSADGMVDTYFEYGHFCFPCDIVTAKYWSNSVYVFTEKHVYRIDERAGDGRVVYSKPPDRVELVAPITNPYAVTCGTAAVYYISDSGVYAIARSRTGTEAVHLPLFNTSQWKSMDLSRAKIHVYQQYLFVYSKDWDCTHIFEIEDGVFSDIEYSNHVRYPYSISAMHTDVNGDLLFASGNKTYRFLEGECYDTTVCCVYPPLCKPCCPYTYQIGIRDRLEIGEPVAAYLNIDPSYGDVTFRLWDGECGKKLVFEKTLSGCDLHEFKLPSCRRLSSCFFVELEGCATVYEMRIGTSNKKLGMNS